MSGTDAPKGATAGAPHDQLPAQLSRRGFLAGIAAAAVVSPAMASWAHGETMFVYVHWQPTREEMIAQLMATDGPLGASHQWSEEALREAAAQVRGAVRSGLGWYSGVLFVDD